MDSRANLDRRLPGREAIDQRIRSWLDDAPTRLTEDAMEPFDSDGDRFRGQFLLMGLEATGSNRADDQSLTAAASVELLHGQAVLNARAAGLLDTGLGSMGRTRALLASDYLHSLAYAGLNRLGVEDSLGEQCFQSMSNASQNLAACWMRADEEPDASIEDVPIDPIVAATAGELAAILGETEADTRRALRATGTALGVARWQESADGSSDDETIPGVEWFPEAWPGGDFRAIIEDKRFEGLLSGLPDSGDLAGLADLIETVGQVQPNRMTHE